MIKEYIDTLVLRRLRVKTEKIEKSLQMAKKKLDSELDRLLTTLISHKPRPIDKRGKK